ncbi:MAG TPA: hypothetical protein VH254_06205 [Candidatus Udaeobacter sp.]|jgi:hypothetical protein|nr:hypothetical protein [Candidatus Udaeobacter sp.]
MFDDSKYSLRLLAAAISFTLPVAVTPSEAAEAAFGLEGRWSGKVQIPGHELVLIVDLAGGTNWSGSATLPGLNVKGAPLTDISVQGADVSFAVQAMTRPGVEAPKVKARLSDKKLVGDFLQGGNTARVVLEKTGPAQVEEMAHSTPVAKEFEGEWNGDYELLGYPRKVTLKLQNHDSLPATADFVIVGRKVNNLAVDRITQQGNFITIECSAFGITYEGQLENGEIHGTVFQGPIEVSVVLRRPK